jgi:hypothetical protein
MRFAALVPAVALLSLTASSAWADEKQVCSDAYQQAQTLRDQHKLVKAREQLRTCAAATCPGFIVKDCTGWLKDVEPRVPSVVLTAKNAAGADVTDVKVTMDGAPLAASLDGIAIDVDPGAHTFAFEGADGRAEQKVVVTEGAKAQHIAVTFGAPGAVAVVTATPGTAATPTASATPSAPSLAAASPAESGFSFGARLGFALPAGSFYGGTDTSVSTTVSAMVPIWLDAGYLINPHFYVGAYFQYGIIIPNDCATGASCSGSDVRIGLEAQYRILPEATIDPWIGAGFGYEFASGSASGFTTAGVPATEGESLGGFEIVHVEAGADYKVLPNLNIGPVVAFSLGEYGSITGNLNGASESLSEPGALHMWIFIMFRGQYDLHI